MINHTRANGLIRYRIVVWNHSIIFIPLKFRTYYPMVIRRLDPNSYPIPLHAEDNELNVLSNDLNPFTCFP